MSARLTIDLSLNEVETTVRKAASGKGWSYSLAEEAGLAAAWLCRQGVDGARLALNALAFPPSSLSPFPAVSLREETQAITNVQAIAIGPCLFDMLLISRNEIQVSCKDCTAFLMGYAGIALRDGFDFLWVNDTGTSGAIRQFQVQFQGQVLQEAGTGLSFRRMDCDPSATFELPLAKTRAPVLQDVWHSLSALAEKSYVPASSRSRAGAGAGTSDND